MLLSETQAIKELAEILYPFLPGKPHPYADQDISFLGAAKLAGVEDFWLGGSKKTAIIKLFDLTLTNRPNKFCDLVINIVQKSLLYTNRDHPLTKEEIEKLNKTILKFNFKIPELWDQTFLHSLPSIKPEPYINNTSEFNSLQFKTNLIALTQMQANQRGFAFEKFLNELFSASQLAPRNSFRIIGEQIDGSFQIDSHNYLLEAKWQNDPIRESDLLIFNGKVSGKATWARGLFISYNSFSHDALEAFSRGKATNIIGMTSLDLFFILDDKISLTEAIRKKARWAAETGEFYKSLYELSGYYE